MGSSAIRVMADGDLAAADAVLRPAFGVATSFVPRLERYRAIEPEGWFLAEDDDGVVGTVGTIGYGAFAYIGLMSVRPGAQRRGIGRALLEHALAWLEARGIGCAILDATEEGAAMYRGLGFVEVGTSHDLAAGADVALEGGPVEPADRDEVIALDRAIFGADRARMWQRLWDEEPAMTRVVRDGAGAAIGYACARAAGLGPWGARTAEAATALLADAAARGLPLRALVPGDNAAARALLADLGFVEKRRVRHMRRGAIERAPRWPDVYGKASFCLG